MKKIILLTLITSVLFGSYCSASENNLSIEDLEKYALEQRDSKRYSNVNNIAMKINIEIARGKKLDDLIITQKENTLIINGEEKKAKQGIANFDNLKLKAIDLKDPLTGDDYPVSVVSGGTGATAYIFLQVATISEEKEKAIVVGNFFRYNDEADSISLITNENGEFVTLNGNVLPYEIPKQKKQEDENLACVKDLILIRIKLQNNNEANRTLNMIDNIIENKKDNKEFLKTLGEKGQEILNKGKIKNNTTNDILKYLVTISNCNAIFQ